MNQNFTTGFFEKLAISLPTRIATTIGQGAKKIMANPAGRKAVTGAAIGAGVGAVGNAVVGDKNESLGSRVAKGAVGGGVAGALVSNIANKGGIKNPFKVTSPGGPGIPPGGASGGLNKPIVKTAFMVGFEKQAGGAGIAGKLVGLGKNAPAYIGGQIASLPSKAKAVGQQVVKGIEANKREFNIAKNKAIGPAGRIGQGTSMKGKTPDLSHVSAQAKVNTGKESPAAFKRDKGSFLNSARNVATAGVVAGTAGVAMGMKDKDENQQQRY